MAALSAGRMTPSRTADVVVGPVAAGAVCYEGGIAVRDASGNLKPAVTATGLRAVGVFTARADNTGGGAAAITAEYTRGCFGMENSAAADEITKAHVGSVVYLVDDQTVAATSDSGARSPAGICVDVESSWVWVLIGFDALVAPALSLLAASNLSDVANAATARGNLGGGCDTVVLHLDPVSTKAADAAVVRVVSPVAGTIAKIYSVANGALAAGNATLTGKIGSTAITNGVVTIAESGSAAGDVDSATPSAAHTVAVGDVISLTGGGSSTATATASCIVVITPSA
jgi:hypothetical protein